MSIDKLQRVMWRVRSRAPGQERILNLELRRAIMYECGTSPKTLVNNRKALKELGWVKKEGRKWVRLTGKDLTDG